MAVMDIDRVFVAEEIRDTSNHTSTRACSGEFSAKTIFVKNGLNQAVDLQLEGSDEDASVWIPIGSSFQIAASSNDYRTVTDYFPNYHIVASCEIAPSSSDLDIQIIKA